MKSAAGTVTGGGTEISGSGGVGGSSVISNPMVAGLLQLAVLPVIPYGRRSLRRISESELPRRALSRSAISTAFGRGTHCFSSHLL